jgi:DNA-binding LacI/PurR family transcriptional regulator
MRGHTRIALLMPARYQTGGHLDDGFRISAYAETLRQNGIEPRADFICTNAEDSGAISGSVMDMLLRNDREARPTAFIAGNDFMAMHIVSLARQLKLRVPEDVAVIGADNTYIAEASVPSITSVDFSKKDFCKRLADTMLALIRGETPEDQILPVSVCIRETA